MKLKRFNVVALKGSKFVFVLFLICCIMLTLVYNDFNFLRCNAIPTQPTEIIISEEEVREVKFLVSNEKCKIVDLDPFSSEAKRYFHPEKYKPCRKQELLTYVTKNDNIATLHIDNELVPSYSSKGVTCCYSNVTRKHNSSNPDGIYENAHSPITITEDVQKKIDNFDNNTRPISVLFVGIDSISRLNLIRAMPQTYKFVRDNDWVPLTGYNKMDDNTFPNLMAILTGFNNSLSYKICDPFTVGKLDAWYITAYGEDETTLNTFNYRKKGFDTPPTDYYFRPYVMSTEKLAKVTKDSMTYCTGPETAGERIMNLAKDFAFTFRGYPTFGFFWMNSFSHNRLNTPTGMDGKVRSFLEELTNGGVTESSIVIFLSDHGMRFGDIRLTHTGWLEERLPFIYVSFPSWFQERFYNEYATFKNNSHKLTSPFDLHMTLKHILKMQDKNYTVTPSVSCPLCRSLFEEIPYTRSCEEAGITGHWCTCLGFVPISLEKSLEKDVVAFVLNEVHEILKKGKGTRPCAKFKLDRVLKISISQKLPYQNESHLLVQLQTKPKAVFESTLSFIGDIHGQNFTMSGSISRLDSYNDHKLPVKGTMSPQGQTRTRKFFLLILLIAAAVIIITYHSENGSLNSGGFHSLSSYHPKFPRKTKKGFLVYSSKCKIVDLDPLNPDASQFHSVEQYVPCTNEELLSYVAKENNVARIHLNIISPCQNFTDSVTIHENPVQVSCANNAGFAYKNVHVAVIKTKAIEDKIGRSKNQRPLSVLMIGIDSVSRLNLIRTMPLTYRYLEGHKWTPLLGYNKMEDNTFPNLMAILTGFDPVTSNQVCNPDITMLGKLDTCPMIWHNYSKHGYVTAYVEDEADLSTFNYLKAGFKNPPTDYYFRPYVLAAHKLQVTKVDKVSYCTGPETSGERIMNLAKDFSVTFKGSPSLGLFWMNTFSHNELNSPSRMDRKFKDFLEALAMEGVTDSSIIVLFSDHGIRYGKIRLYNTGWLEERLPFIYFSFPSWFKSDYPRLVSNFKTNVNSLTSPYDFYMTLQHILSLADKTFEPKPSIGCPTCRSFFDEIPYNRSCEEAGISIHFCTCYGYSEISLPQNLTLSVSQFVINEIHNRIKTEPRCLSYKLRKVWRTAISQSDSNESYLLVLLETIPEAFFEATLIVTGDITYGNFSLAGSISRTDFYNENGWCTKKLKNLCYCPHQWARS
nr:unnamed protein product [Callosobruchus chinensis]